MTALRRLAGSDYLKLAALVAVFTWPLVFQSTWKSFNDPDVWWHIRSGEWILQHHQLPHTDPFSITGANKPWVAYSWPFGVLIYEIARNWDFLGIVGYVVISWIIISALLLALLRNLGLEFWRALGLTLITNIVLKYLLAPRPGNFTIAFFLLNLLILVRARRAGRKGELWLLPLIIWLWANVHVQFPYGLFLIGVFCIEPFLNRIFRTGTESPIPSIQLWLILVVSAILTVITPYGYGSYRVLVDFVREPRQLLYISEFHSMAFDNPVHFLVLFLLIGTAMLLGRSRKPEPLWILLLAWSAVMGFHMQRDMWVVSMMCAAAVAQSYSSVETNRVDRRVWLGATACVLLIVIGFLKLGPTNKDLRNVVAAKYPLGSVAYIHQHNLRGPIFNTFDWGGFLIYALPEMKVTIDGRTNVHGQDEIDRSFRTWYVWPGWDTDPLLAQANLIIGPPDVQLFQMLKNDPRWKPVFYDGVSVVFQRVGQ